MQATHINAFRVELAEAETELAQAKGKVAQLKETIATMEQADNSDAPTEDVAAQDASLPQTSGSEEPVDELPSQPLVETPEGSDMPPASAEVAPKVKKPAKKSSKS